MSSINFLRLDYEDPVLWDVHVDVLKRRISKLRKLSQLSQMESITKPMNQRRHSSCPSPGPILTCSHQTREGHVSNRKMGRRYGQSFQADGDNYLKNDEML